MYNIHVLCFFTALTNYTQKKGNPKMKFKRILSFFIISSMLLCLVPSGVFAAGPSVTIVEGERTVFISSFGRVSFNGSPYQSYKTFTDAVAALGKEGGRIVLSGATDCSAFVDIPGRGPLTIQGASSASSFGNRLEFGALTTISFEGPIKFVDVVLKASEGAQILTNGHSYSTNINFDTFHEAAFRDKPKTYINPPVISFGKVSGPANLGLAAGKYSQVVAGSINGYNTSGNLVVYMDESSADLVVAGNTGNGTHTGNNSITIKNANIANYLAGSAGGTFNGNSVTEINGGNIDVLKVGTENGAKVNGNVVVVFNGGRVGNISATGSVSGKKVAIVGKDSETSIPSGVFDYILRTESGFCEAVFDADKIVGFRVLNEMGIPATSITVNGSSITSANGIYELSTGESKISVPDTGKLTLNKYSNYIKGYEDSSFRPQNNMTKAEAVTLLARLLIDENLIKGSVQSNYLDVAAGSWYESYIGFFERLGFLDLVSEDNGLSFAPDKNITRAQFTQLIYEISEKDNNAAAKKSKAFVDVSSSNPFKTAINFAASSGIITGYEDATFRPDNNITRAEVVTMVNRLLGRVPTGVAGSNSFYDIVGHWASGQILASCNPENVSWTAKSTDSDKYTLTGTSAKDYITSLHQQGTTLSAAAIRDGVDVISEQMKKDVLNQPDSLDLNGKKRYYISEKNGNDANDGLTPETPFKTIAGLSKVTFIRNAAILFERGGIYRGTIQFTPYTYYGAYGDPSLPKPLLMQSRRNFADPSLWVETEYPNVYKCTELFHNVGVVGFDHDLFDYSEKCYDELYGEIEGLDMEGFKGVEDLNKDLQFYNELPEGVTDTDLRTANAYGPLYIYSEKGNPGERFESIEVGERFAIFRGDPTGNIIENLAMKFTGAHAVETSKMRGLTARGCVFSWVGGSMLSMNKGVGLPYRYGNAIEGQICEDFICENNWAYQIYDTGLTHQRSECPGTIIQDNIRYTNNLVEYCHWGIEFYNNPAGKKPSDITLTKNHYIAYNVVRYTGYGWGSIVSNRSDSCQAYHGSSCGKTENLVTEYNIFDRSAGFLLNVVPGFNINENCNIYIQHLGNTLGNLNGNYHKCDENMAEYIVNEWKDENGIIILIDPEKEPTKNLFK